MTDLLEKVVANFTRKETIALVSLTEDDVNTVYDTVEKRVQAEAEKKQNGGNDGADQNTENQNGADGEETKEELKEEEPKKIAGYDRSSLGTNNVVGNDSDDPLENFQGRKDIAQRLLDGASVEELENPENPENPEKEKPLKYFRVHILETKQKLEEIGLLTVGETKEN